jgi:murein DD-endopeptidase MepM/ murein hydrolase activator NlpD
MSVMRMNRKKDYTLMVIPDNGKGVICFRVSRIALLTILIAIPAVCIYIYMLHALYSAKTENLKSAERQLSITEQLLADTAQDKDQEIQSLKTELDTVTRQALQIREKVETLQELETELRNMMGEGLDSAQHGIADAPDTNLSDSESSKGGAFYPIEESVIHREESLNAISFPELDRQIAQLIAGLTDAKQAFEAYLHELSVTPSILPTTSARITSGFGTRRDPFTNTPALHTGIDFGAPLHADVYATADGAVYAAGKDKVRGNFVTIDHGGGLKTTYMHMSEVIVKRNQAVKKGEVIGYVGSTGRSTGPHLHYEVSLNGKAIDPQPYLNLSLKE